MSLSRKQALNLIINNPVEIGRSLGFRDLTEIHNTWLKKMLLSTADMTLQGHRGSYKTTVLSLFFAIHCVLRPYETLLYFRKTDSDVTEIAKQTQKILKSPLLHELAIALYSHDYILTKESSNEINTSLNQSVKGASQILGLGIGTSITGKHADVVVTDDIVNLTDRISKAERERTKSAYREMQNIKNRGGRFINTGTPWHKDDAFCLMPPPIKYDCYMTGLISEAELMHLKQSMTASLFSANYELKHIASEDIIFDNPRIGYDISLVEQGNCHIDASYGGSDYTAFTICHKKDGKYYIYGRLWQKHVDDCIDEIIEIRKSLNAGRISMETNGDKGYLSKSLRSKGERTHAYHENMNKYLKITSYLKAEWVNVYFVAGTDAEYINQILEYNENAEHDDSPDSLSSIVRELWSKSGSNSIDTSNLLYL